MKLDQKAGLSLNGQHLTGEEIKEGKKILNDFFQKIKGKTQEEEIKKEVIIESTVNKTITVNETFVVQNTSTCTKTIIKKKKNKKKASGNCVIV